MYSNLPFLQPLNTAAVSLATQRRIRNHSARRDYQVVSPISVSSVLQSPKALGNTQMIENIHRSAQLLTFNNNTCSSVLSGRQSHVKIWPKPSFLIPPHGGIRDFFDVIIVDDISLSLHPFSRRPRYIQTIRITGLNIRSYLLKHFLYR